MKTTTKAYIVTGLSYIPMAWVMKIILGGQPFASCLMAVVGPDSGPELVCPLTSLGWVLFVLLALLPLAVLLFWRKNVITKKRP